MAIAGSASIRRLNDVAVVMGLHEFAPVGRRPAGWRVGPGIGIRIAAACRGVLADGMPTGGGVAPLANVADGERRDGGPGREQVGE
jgi:hypothetical protein